PRAEIVDGAHQTLPEVMLPDAIHDHTRDQRAGAVLDVRHPFRQGAPLLRGIASAALSARGCPIIPGRFAPREHGEKTQLDRFALRTEITAGQQECLARYGAEIRESQRRGQRLWFARLHTFERVLPLIPFGTLFIRKEWPKILV